MVRSGLKGRVRHLSLPCRVLHPGRNAPPHLPAPRPLGEEGPLAAAGPETARTANVLLERKLTASVPPTLRAIITPQPQGRTDL